jgi:phosphatidylinositol-4,5-bisphosphate 4-phosphatase
MSIGLEDFRRAAAARGDRLILDRDTEGTTTGLKKTKLRVDEESVIWKQVELGNFDSPPIREYQQQNREFKQAFYQALVKSNGQEIADRAVNAAGLPTDWQATGSSFGSKQVTQVLDKAQMLRKSDRDQTERNVRDFLMPGRGFEEVFKHENLIGAANNLDLPADAVRDDQLRAEFRREVKQDPSYGKVAMYTKELSEIAEQAIRKFAAQKRAAFREQYPELANFVQNRNARLVRDGNTPDLHEDAGRLFMELKDRLDPAPANDDPLSKEPVTFRDAATKALDAISSVKDNLRQMSYDPKGMRDLGQTLIDKYLELQNLEQQFSDLAAQNEPKSRAGLHLSLALVREIRHQKDLLLAKAGFLDDVRENDPLSEKMVAYSDLLWARAVGKLIGEALTYFPASSLADGDKAVDRLVKAAARYLGDKKTAYDNASTIKRTTDPGMVKEARDNAEEFLRGALQEAGLPELAINNLASKESLLAARRDILNTNPDWAPVSRDMVVTRDGVTRTYRSQIIPAAHINPRFTRRYASNQPLEAGGPPHAPLSGVSSMTKADHYHPRNLKVSTLEQVLPDGTTRSKATVIGNAVLDMWDIADPDERARANERGAKEVLEAAIATNDRIRHEALNRSANGDNTPVKLTHVSVNLVTPSGVRELPVVEMVKPEVHDYKELTYTKNQFSAFDANTSAGQGANSVPFQVDDDRPNQPPHQDVRINVDVDVISFSFAINPMATGKIPKINLDMPEFVGGWANVYKHNRTQMEKFIGDLGEGKLGAHGAEPGGFVGKVYDLLDETNPFDAPLRARIREQTNIVRDMFTSGAFKRGDGDPAKMGRHILALQGLAEEALSLLDVKDMAATMSKGCKSDKDRGGVTDVELKHQIITEDMGGQIFPNAKLEGDDEQNYYVVAAASGQLENQRFNTGVPGSKEAGKLEQRIRDLFVRLYLSGLGEFAAE